MVDIGDLGNLISIIWLDIVLSGDNALVIGLAASALPKEMQRRAIIFGMVLATVIRIVFAVLIVYLLAIPGLKFIGGLLLVWVCWRLFRDVQSHMKGYSEDQESIQKSDKSERQLLISALLSITLADVSMSLDNVLAVASIARESVPLLVFGLVLSIILMAFFSTFIVRLLNRFPVISYVGLGLLIYIALRLIYEGWFDLVASGYIPMG